jgi:hypothetical protein
VLAFSFCTLVPPAPVGALIVYPVAIGIVTIFGENGARPRSSGVNLN